MRAAPFTGPPGLPRRPGGGGRRALAGVTLGASVAGAVVAGTLVAGGPGGPRTAVPVATGTLADLMTAGVPALGLPAFHGTFGTAASAVHAGPDGGDFADPSDLRTRLSVEGTPVVRTDAGPAGTSARAGAAGFTLALLRPDFLSVGALAAVAACTPASPGHPAWASARVDAAAVTVAGHPVPPGATRLDVTGAEFGLPGAVGSAALTVTYRRLAAPAAPSHATSAAARAGLEVTVTGTFTGAGTGGRTLYDGPVVRLELGEVAVECASAATTTAAATTAAAAVDNPTRPAFRRARRIDDVLTGQ